MVAPLYLEYRDKVYTRSEDYFGEAENTCWFVFHREYIVDVVHTLKAATEIMKTLRGGKTKHFMIPYVEIM